MKKAEIVDGVVELLQDSSAAMRANANRWTNYVLDDIASRGYLKSLQREERATLRPGSGTDMNTGRNYDLNTDTDKVFKCFVPAWGKDGRLRKISEDDFLNRMLEDGVLSTGRPLFYMIFGLKTLRIHPIPSAQYAPAVPTREQMLYVWKYKDVTHLKENDDITEWKVKHTPCIVSGAYAYGTRFDDLGDLAAAIQQYETLIRRLFDDENHTLDQAWQVKYNDY